MVAYGEVPSYSGEEPSKASTQQYSYEFSGWNVEPEAVTQAATYTAVYNSIINEYTVAFDSEG
jgi:hypothetical protein